MVTATESVDSDLRKDSYHLEKFGVEKEFLEDNAMSLATRKEYTGIKYFDKKYECQEPIVIGEKMYICTIYKTIHQDIVINIHRQNNPLTPGMEAILGMCYYNRYEDDYFYCMYLHMDEIGNGDEFYEILYDPDIILHLLMGRTKFIEEWYEKTVNFIKKINKHKKGGEN